MSNSPVWFKRAYTIVFTALLLAAAAGCTVGPKYKRPTYPTPPAFRGADDAAVISDAQGSLGDQQWAQVFREPELQDLIRKALTNNYDLRIAAQRILEQQAQVQITRSQQFPTLSVGGTGAGVDIPGISSYTGGGANSISSPIVVGDFSLSAAWNPDFWGLYRKQTEAARATLLAQTWAQRAVRLTLVQQVATTYIQLRALDREVEVTQQTLKARQDSVDLTRRLESGGSVPLSDLRQAEQLLYTATSQLPQLEQQVQQQENALRLLTRRKSGSGSPHGSNRAHAPTAGFANRHPFAIIGTPAGYPAIGGAAQSGQREHWRGACAVLSPAIDQCFRRHRGRQFLQHLRQQLSDHLRNRLVDPAAF